MSQTNIEIVRIKDRDYVAWEDRYYYCMHAKRLNRPSPFHSGTHGGIGIDELVNVHTGAKLIEHPNHLVVKDFYEKEYCRSLKDEVDAYIKSKSSRDTHQDDLIKFLQNPDIFVRAAKLTYNNHMHENYGMVANTHPTEGTLTIEFIQGAQHDKYRISS